MTLRVSSSIHSFIQLKYEIVSCEIITMIIIRMNDDRTIEFHWSTRFWTNLRHREWKWRNVLVEALTDVSYAEVIKVENRKVFPTLVRLNQLGSIGMFFNPLLQSSHSIERVKWLIKFSSLSETMATASRWCNTSSEDINNKECHY